MYNINFERPESVIDHIMCGMARAMFDISYMRFIDRFDNGDDEMTSQTERDFVSLLFDANAILRPTHGEKKRLLGGMYAQQHAALLSVSGCLPVRSDSCP